jgi:hypothetical protein
VLERVGLADVGRRPVKAYSMGMRQRLGLAAALLRQPRLLILDEPTNGLDPQGIHELRTLFVDLVHEGTTVFLSSHLLAEVELICTRAAMMANGKLVAQDRVDALLAPTGRLRIESPDASEAAAFLRTRHMTVEWLDQQHLRVHLNGEPAETINSLLVGPGPAHPRALPRTADAGGRVPRPHRGDTVRGRRRALPARSPLRSRRSRTRARCARGSRRDRRRALQAPPPSPHVGDDHAAAGLPVVVGIFLKATGIAPRPGSGPALLSEVLNNGVCSRPPPSR